MSVNVNYLNIPVILPILFLVLKEYKVVAYLNPSLCRFYTGTCTEDSDYAAL